MLFCSARTSQLLENHKRGTFKEIAGRESKGEGGANLSQAQFWNLRYLSTVIITIYRSSVAPSLLLSITLMTRLGESFEIGSDPLCVAETVLDDAQTSFVGRKNILHVTQRESRKN